MPVIKQTNTRSAMKEAVVLDLGDLGRQAARLRAAAEVQAARIVSDAEHAAAELVETASARGFDQGLRDGCEQGQVQGREQGRAEALKQLAEQLEQLCTGLNEAVTSWETQRTQLDHEARQTVVDFALKLAELVVHRVISVDRQVIVDQVAGVLSLVLHPQDVTLRINSRDMPVLKEALPQLVANLDSAAHVQLAEDEQVSPGGCVVSYGQGLIDATIETQLRRVVEFVLPEKASGE